MEEYFNGLLKEVDQRMATTAPGMDGKEVIGVCREMVSYLKGKNRELKEYALAHPFAGDAKEILYFKYYKPALTGRLLYYYRVYQIESGCPACLRVAEPYYRKAMERAERMMERYLPFYQYYHSGATYRDSYYFLRAKGELSPESGSFVLDEEAEFSTGYDILAARLISVEMLLVHLSRRMERAAQGTETEAVPEKEHRWTNTKVAAILLVYGIHVTGSVDEGNAEIGELAALFEKHFHVDLGNVYHAFGRLRGQQNPTAFLDEMKERLLKRCGTWIAGSKLATGRQRRQDTGRERPKGWKEPSGRSFLPRLGPFYRPERRQGRKCAPKKNLCQGAGIVAGKTGESGDICGRNLKMSTTMEIMTIESNAYRLLVEKIEKITAYVEESRNREETERKRKEEAESPVTKGRKADPKWMTHKEVCEALDISHRTLQRYRQKNIVPYSMIGRQIRYPRQAVESLRERWMVETPAAKIDRMIAEHPLHNRKNGSYGKKGRSAGKNQ